MTQFLIKKHSGKNAKAHLWDGRDTVCRMYSTGGLNPTKYTVSDKQYDLHVCHMCSEVMLKTLRRIR